jgi:hypothetical protein
VILGVVAAALLLPWVVRVYAWWWDVAFGAGAFLDTWAPKTP